jgi:hypothetical protein
MLPRGTDIMSNSRPVASHNPQFSRVDGKLQNPRSPFRVFRNSSYAYLALLALSVFAFWPRYLSRLREAIDQHTHWHTILAVMWCALLVIQPQLVVRNLSLHRRLGRTAYILAPAFAAASLMLAHARFRAMDDQAFRREAATMFLPLSAVVLFVIAVSLAIYYRKVLPLHARFMLLSGLPMIDPVVGRVLYFYGPSLRHPLYYQAITFGVTDFIVAGLLLYPHMRARLRIAYGLPALVFPLTHLAWFTVAQGPLWLPLASWFRSLQVP